MTEQGNEHRIVKELSNSHKAFRFLGMDLEAQQFVLLAGILAPIALLGRLGVFEWLGLSPGQVVAIIAPIVLAGLAFTFLKWQGRNLSFIAGKKLQSLIRNSTLVWRARPPGSVMWLRDSVQRWLPAEEPVWDMFKTNNGTYLRIIEVEASSLSLASEEQRETNRAQLADAYTTFGFNVTEISRSRPSAMGTYLARLRDEIQREVGSPDISEEEAIKLRAFGDEHIVHLKDIVAERQAYEHKSFIVITYNPSEEEQPSASPAPQLKGVLTPFIPFVGGRRASKRATRRAQEEATLAYRKLSERVATAVEYYGRLGLTLRPLGEYEGLAFIAEEAGGSNLAGVKSDSGAPAETQTPMKLGPTITLTDEQYTKLSRKAIGRRIDAAEEVRSGRDDEPGAPSVVGLGELAANDRIAPEAVQVHSDYLKVGTSFHRTVYIYDLPETVRAGFLQPLAEMKQRVKIVKFIRPVPTKEALDFIGRKKSSLLAAEKITSQGNVLEREHRRRARESADFAHEQVGSSKQRYHQLVVLIHLEADSLEELDSLTDDVKTKLDERYASSRLALEEMWEGYVSCLPFGENHLVEKYCASGILTDPVSCFSTFSSLELNHAYGVLYGTDKQTNAPVNYDDRLVDNRHKVILGGSGKGKTVLVKALSSRSRLRGETNILIDPEGRTRYEAVAKRIGGQFVKLGQGSASKINPFDLPEDYPDLDLLGDSIDEEADPEEALRIAREGAFNSKVGTLVTLIGLMATANDSAANSTGGIDPGLRGKIEEVVVDAYTDRGISEDPDSHYQEPPTMEEFFGKLAGYSETDDDLADLRKKLYSWEKGSLRKIFSGQTNVNLRSKYLVVRISAAESGPEKAPLMFTLLDYLRGRLADPRESITCWIDEFWSLLKHPMAVELLNQLWRASRASGTAMVGITQDLEEFTSSDQAATIMRQSQTYVLLGQGKKFVERIDGFTELAQETKKEISKFARGEALLIAGQRQIPIKISISEEEEKLFHTTAEGVAVRQTAEPRYSDGSHNQRHNRSLATPSSGGRDKTAEIAASNGAAATEKDAPKAGESKSVGTNGSEAEPVPTLAELAPYASCQTDGLLSNGGAGGVAIRAGASPAGTREGRIYAVGGQSATEVAFSLAGLLSTAATRNATGGKVLLVDASRVLTTTPMFASIPLPATDELIYSLGNNLGGGNGADQPEDGKKARRLEDYLIRNEESGLSVLRYPDQDSMPASALADFLASHFDAVVVACGKRTGDDGGGYGWPRYPEEWVLSATRITAAANSPDGLSKTIENFERLGDFNEAPLLALTGSSNRCEEETDNLPTKDVLTLPDADVLDRYMQQGAFAPIQDPGAGEGFARLAHGLAR